MFPFIHANYVLYRIIYQGHMGYFGVSSHNLRSHFTVFQASIYSMLLSYCDMPLYSTAFVNTLCML